MSRCVITSLRHGPMAAGRARPARAGGDGALRRARLRADDRRRDRRARRPDRADVLPLLRRQARGAVRRLRQRSASGWSTALAAAPASAAPLGAVAAALDAVAALIGERPRLLAPAPGGHRRERRTARARADQARRLVDRARRRAAPARRRPSRRRAWPPRPASPCSAWRSSAGSASPATGSLRTTAAQVVRPAQRRHRRRADAHRVQWPARLCTRGQLTRRRPRWCGRHAKAENGGSG